ncbi:hypothetical protein ACH4ZU_03875 [Streptomyces sp. NPDC020472]|uniref:hypothetical protein n=1 Tax=Streptomyces sp. NPDC020472 TaxID=3365075 RepID=UPI00378DE1C0
MSGPEDGRGFARMLRVSTLALCLEAGVALAVLMTIGLSTEPDPGEDTGGGAMFVVALPFLAVVGVLVAFAVSAVLVLPVVLLGEDLGRRVGGRPVWWQLSLAALAGGLLAPLSGGWGWLAGGTALSVAALLARRARRGHFVGLLLWGTGAVLTAFLAGGAVLSATGA